MTYRRMPVRPPRAVLGSVVLAAAVLLAGCNGDAEPAPTPSTVATTPVETASPEPTPTQTATETATAAPTETSALPPLPEEATQNTPEGAEAFIRYYFDVLNQLHREPQVGVIPQVAEDGCESCESAESNIQWLVEEEAQFDSNIYELGQLRHIGGGDPGVTRFDATWRMPGSEVVNAGGTTISDVPPEEFTGIIGAIWTGEKWLFYDAAHS